jgi:hypothetical protein
MSANKIIMLENVSLAATLALLRGVTYRVAIASGVDPSLASRVAAGTRKSVKVSATFEHEFKMIREHLNRRHTLVESA